MCQKGWKWKLVKIQKCHQNLLPEYHKVWVSSTARRPNQRTARSAPPGGALGKMVCLMFGGWGGGAMETPLLDSHHGIQRTPTTTPTPRGAPLPSDQYSPKTLP